MEEAFFFENEGHRIFGMLHYPSWESRNGSSSANVGIVFCHAFGDEAFRTHREMVVYARRLAKEGYAVLRFDYRGCGDSEGNFEDFTLKTRISDIRRAVDTLVEKSGVESIGLLGLRFGGALAAALATRDPRIEYLILWAPIVNGTKYVQFLQQSQMAHELGNFGKVISTRKRITEKLASSGTFDLMANIISQEVYKELLSFNPWKTSNRYPKHILIIGIEGDSHKASSLRALNEAYPNAETTLIKEKQFWFDKINQNPSNLYETTSQWLRSILHDFRQ